MKLRNSCRSASALVIILPIIAILALIILTILSIALFDSRLASNSFAQAQAGSMVKYAIDDVSDKLYQIPLDRHWAAGPGRIRYWDGVSSWTNIELYSGTNSTTPAAASNYLDGATAATAAQCVQLNVPLPDGSYTIMSTNSAFPTAPDMTVKWIYVLQDGTIQTNAALLPNQGVIGRYAYWTDVENGRVNINTAGFGMVNGPPTPSNASNPTGRFQWAVENWNGLTNNPITDTVTLASYAANVLAPNPWISDRMQTNATGGVSFPALDRPTAQANTIQNLTAHPSSIDLSFLDGVSVAQSFNTFRYAGSYFLRVDARNSYSYILGSPSFAATDASFSPAPSPDISVRFFNDPSDWQLIVDPATYQRNKGYITVRGRSPEINPWGLPKIALSLPSKDGHALNDLTEYYYRTVAGYPEGANNTREDSRLTQVPWLATQSSAGSTTNAPPYPLMAARSSFRDLSSSDPASDPSANNVLYVAALMNDLKNVLNTSIPGFTTSLGAKYNAYGTSGGECEQVATEIMSFVDGCLNPTFPGYAPFNTQGGVSFYGLSLPMTANGSTRRQGTNGQFLLNEIAMQAESVSYQSGYNWQLAGFSGYNLGALTPIALPSVATASPAPKFIITSISGAAAPALFVFLRQPTDDSTPDKKSPDRFIKVALNAEMITPPHFGFAQPLGWGYQKPEGDIENTVIQYSTDDVNWSTAYSFDIYGNQKVNGVGSSVSPDAPPVYTSDNPSVQNSAPHANEGVYAAVQSFVGSQYPTLNPILTQDSYTQMVQNTGASIWIGPFNPTSTPSVSLKIKSRLIFEYNTITGNGTPTAIWEGVPGIFPDFPGGNPSAASYIANSGNPDPNDLPNPSPAPNPNGGNAASITTNWLEFDFTDVSVGVGPTVTADYEATDPRVTRHNTDWKLNTSGGTMGAQNSTYTSSTDDSKLARPPSILQTIRGPVRVQALTPNGGGAAAQPEFQTASRILGLPGVGYLSEVPTGVDSGIPWSTMKFNVNAINDSPPDWLFWNLFYVPFDRSMSNQTDGKLNINARLYPFTDSNGNVLVREKPLEALLGNRVRNPTTLATAIAAGPTYTNGGALPSDLYVYPGQICQIPGFADGSTGSDQYDQEYLSRDLADIVTTQSSDYRVFVVAQTLKQSSTGQITPVTTQRVEATLSRVVDAGKQGYAFSMYDNGGYPFTAYLRSAYRPSSNGAAVPTATRTEVMQAPHAQGYSPLGLDHTPNTADDWLIPQKIEISSYKIVK